LGAARDEGTYPLQLARALAELGAAARIVNGGWPGQDSRDVVARLQGQLEHFRPERVCILMGCNDRWKRPRLLEPDAAPPAAGFPWVWRTGRLLALASQPRVSADPAALLGPWHDAIDEVEFVADGQLLVSGMPFRWRATAGDLLVRIPPETSETKVEWRVEGATLEMQCALWPRPLRLERGPNPLHRQGLDPNAVHTASHGTPAANDAVLPVLRAHLEQAVDQCRRHGATPILLSYPESDAGHLATVRDVATRHGLQWVDMTPVFAAQLATRPRAELFVPDGHCNAGGYALRAETLASTLR
jgi:lysophospholipase L1-like esterase